MINVNNNNFIYNNLVAKKLMFTDCNLQRGLVKIYNNNSKPSAVICNKSTNLTTNYVYYIENNINYCDYTVTCKSCPVYSLLTVKLLGKASGISYFIPIISVNINNQEISLNIEENDNISYLTFFIPKNEDFKLTSKLQVSSTNANINANRLFIL